MAKNRCYGCVNFEGESGCYAICKLGYKNILLNSGCPDFSPDDVACCKSAGSTCFYNKTKSFDNIECEIHGYVGSIQSYCYDYAMADTDCDSKKKGCFVSTFICNDLKMDDNCYELTILRKFRDDILLTTQEGTKLVDNYYKQSPYLIKLLNKYNDKSYSKYLYKKYIKKIIYLINNSYTEKAINEYTNMIEDIKKNRR